MFFYCEYFDMHKLWKITFYVMIFLVWMFRVHISLPEFPWFFSRKSTWTSLIFMKNLDLFPWVKFWALDFSCNLNGNTNVCNNTETWRSMQLTNTIQQYTKFKQSSERKLLQWRTRTILIRQFKYCFSNF